jgi:excisionase family DNA binding protein
VVSQVARAGTRREWLTIHEASALIGVSPATLRRWSDAGEVKAFTTPGGHRRFARSAVLGLLPSTRRERPNLERLGETPDRLARVYRRQIGKAADTTGWIRRLGEDERVPFRDHGRRIANALLAFFDAPTPEDRETSIVEAELGAAEYGRIAAERGIPIADTVELFLRFRMPFYRELGAVARRRALDTSEATDLLETATEAIDRLLGALMRGYEAASSCAVFPAARAGAAS